MAIAKLSETADGMPMKRALIALSLVLGFLVVAGACQTAAADDDRPLIWRYNSHSPELPFSRTERAQSVWAGGACWSECGSHCTWGLAACLQQDAQGKCILLGDACDRYCQRECRGFAGPLIPDYLDFLN
jgi:hypothetical protein